MSHMFIRGLSSLAFAVLVSSAALWMGDAVADTIYLKDGTTESSDRVWETDDYVHFILKGTQSVEVRYAKEFVERIERDNAQDPPSGSGPEKAAQPAAQQRESLTDGPPAQSDKPEGAPDEQHVDPKLVQANKGVSFYDPRRKARYWSGYKTGHTTLQEALAALAARYGRSVAWVQLHMGEENDLGRIHLHLMRQLEQESRADRAQTGGEAQQRDPGSIAVSEVREPPVNATDIADPDAGNAHRFYEPRRTQKYWISPVRGFDTLDEALSALAGEYGVSRAWIEKHIGDSNSLDEIHRNIRRSLGAP